MRDGGSVNLLKIVAVTLSIPFLANAASITYTYTQNPAYVNATLDVSCDKALENFEKQMAKVVGSIPYIAGSRLMSASDWKEETKTETVVVTTKTLNIAASPTLTKEFPTTFVPASVSKTVCPPKKDGTAACVNTIVVMFYGSQAVTYQKVTEATKSQNFLKSFRGTMTFTDSGVSACTFNNQLNIDDNTYLWVKKHLIADLNPTLIEGRILNRFVDWAKNILPTMEGK